MATATKALALDETLQDVVSELQRITGVAITEALDDLSDVNASTPANGDTIQFDSSSQKWINSNSRAAKADISSIVATGATNTTGAKIIAGAIFYLDGVLCRAKTDIATGASFTLNTNYTTFTIGENVIIEKRASIAFAAGYAKISKPTGFLLISATEENAQGVPYICADYSSSQALIFPITFSGQNLIYNTASMTRTLVLTWVKNN